MRPAERAAQLNRAQLQSKDGPYAHNAENISIDLAASASAARLVIIAPDGVRSITPAKDRKSGRLTLQSGV
jgi:hypothetical protein